MDLAAQVLNRSYVLHGRGGITTVQARLTEYGRCQFTFWDPSPPDWRARFITYLNRDDVRQLLEGDLKRFDIRLFQEIAAYMRDD
jgi:hypothetical protein